MTGPSASAASYYIPPEAAERLRLREQAARYAADHRLVPPLVMAELDEHTARLLAEVSCDARAREYVYVLLNNAAWRPVVEAVPFERRTLLLPPCLRAADCPASFDKLGLLCDRCGRCDIGALSDEAEDLGYTVLVIEGSSIAADLVLHGTIDAVIGVGCMDALSRAFPHMVAAAVPGLAIPLVRDGCRATAVDTQWVREAVRAVAPPADGARGNGYSPLDLAALRSAVAAWFDTDALRGLLELGGTEMEELALHSLAGPGKRWRPFLCAAVYSALRDGGGAAPDAVRRVAVALECIHKASLIYDDIQDDDAQRYGAPTVHREHGVPVALTVSLLLLGLGYRMIADAPLPAGVRTEMLHLATAGHGRLCLGQGRELLWMRNRRPLSADEVTDIFAGKTAPSFEVVLRLGAMCTGADDAVHRILGAYSRALGVAYQVRDDLDDFTAGGDADDVLAQRPSIVMALAYEAADARERAVLREAWTSAGGNAAAAAARRVVKKRDVLAAAQRTLTEHTNAALAALAPLRQARLKTVLCRIVGQVFETGPTT